MATVKRELETVYRYHHHHDEGDEGDESEEEELQEKVLRFSYDGSLPVDRKLLKPLFHIEALRSANGINATLPRLHNHKDLGYALADLAMVAMSHMDIPGGMNAPTENVMGMNIGGTDDGENKNEDRGDSGDSGDIGEEADPMEIKIRVLFALLADDDGKCELVEICETLADSDDADELLMGNDQWRFPEFDGNDDEDALLSKLMTVEECLEQFRVKGTGTNKKKSLSSNPKTTEPSKRSTEPQPGYFGSKAEIAKGLFLRMRLDDHHVLDKTLQGYGRGMTFCTGRSGEDSKYIFTDMATYNVHGATHSIQKLRVAMHSVIQRGADVHSLFQSYDKHAYGAVSGVLRVTTLYDAITLMIERHLITKAIWKKEVVPFLLSNFGTMEQFADVHKIYPTEEGVEYDRFVEWCALPLPDYHNDPGADIPCSKMQHRGDDGKIYGIAPLLGSEHPDYFANRTNTSESNFDSVTPLGMRRRGRGRNSELDNTLGDSTSTWGGTNVSNSGGFGGNDGNDGSWNTQQDSKDADTKDADTKDDGKKNDNNKEMRKGTMKRKGKRKVKKKKKKKKHVEGEGGSNSDDYADTDDEDYFDEIEGDFSRDDAMYFRNLSLSYGVGTFETEQKAKMKKKKEEKETLQKQLKEKPKQAKNNRKNSNRNQLNQQPPPPATDLDDSAKIDDSMNERANDERPSSQGFMFLPPTIAKEAEQMQRQQQMGFGGIGNNLLGDIIDDEMFMGGRDDEDSPGLDDIGVSALSEDVWTWNDETDGGGDAFFGNGVGVKRGEEDFMLSGAGPRQQTQQPQPPKSLPPNDMRSPMQKRLQGGSAARGAVQYN